MSQNSSTSNDVQQQAASKRADNSSSSSFNPCDNNQRNTNEQSAILNQENVTATSARLSSSEEDMQETPIDFSLPKCKRKISPHRRQTFLQQTYYVSSSPPLNMSSQRSTPDKMHEAGYNGSRSPSNLYSQHPNSNSNLELFANGHIVASRLSPEMMIRERSQSFSSVTQIRQRHSAAHHPHILSSNSEVGPSNTHASDPALSQNVTHPLTYAEIIPQSMAVGTNATGISSLAPNEVLNHYGFLPAGVESSFAESLGRNGLLTSSLHNKLSSGELPTTNSAKLLATIKTTSPSLTVTTSPSLTINTSPSLTVTTSTTLAVTTSPALVVTTSPSLAVTASPSLAASAPGVTKRRRSLPDDQKDRAYWERRRKNNVAAKRSRDARRVKEEAISLRAALLEQENIKLRCEIANLKAETEKLKVLLYEN